MAVMMVQGEQVITIRINRYGVKYYNAPTKASMDRATKLILGGPHSYNAFAMWAHRPDREDRRAVELAKAIVEPDAQDELDDVHAELAEATEAIRQIKEDWADLVDSKSYWREQAEQAREELANIMLGGAL